MVFNNEGLIDTHISSRVFDPGNDCMYDLMEKVHGTFIFRPHYSLYFLK